MGILNPEEEHTYYVTVPSSNDSDTAVVSDASREVEGLTNNPFLAELIGTSLREARSKNPDRIAKEIVIDGIPWEYKVASDRKGGHVIAFKKLTDPEEIGRRQLEEVAASMMPHLSHDVRSHLTAIKGRCELLTLSYDLTEEDREAIESIIEASDRLVSCCETYMSWFKNPDQSFEDDVDINTSLDRVVKGTSKRYQNVEIITNYSKDLPKIKASYRSLDLLWHNLLSNACESTKNTGRPRKVIISTKMRYSSTDSIRVTFEDNGNGMDDKTKAAWKSTGFVEPFSTKDKGRGWGRAVIMHMMQRNNAAGHSVETQPGKGTKFYVYFEPAYK